MDAMATATNFWTPNLAQADRRAYSRRAVGTFPVEILAVCLLLAGATGALAQSSTPTADGSGSWMVVAPKTLQHTIDAVGSLRAQQTTRLGLQVSGRVKDVLVDVGDFVKTGQELVRLDPEFFQIELAQRQADLDSAKVAVAEATLNLNRMKGLFDRPAGEAPSVARKQLDDAQSAFDGAEARLRGAENALRYSAKRLQEAVVRAPYNAVVTKRLVDPGEPATSAPITQLIEVQEVDVLQLEFALPQEMLARVRKGTPVTFEVPGAAVPKGSGSISVVYPAIDESTRSFRCRVNVDNRDFRYRPGQLAQVKVVDQEVPNALAVPRSSLQQAANGWRVLVDVDGKPTPKNVKVGLTTDEAAEIQQGITAGEKVWVPARR